jgi:hypothetical protein
VTDPPRTQDAIHHATAAQDAAGFCVAAKAGAGGAANPANASRPANQLSGQEAASVFTSTGELQPEVIANSREIIPGSQLRNPDVTNELTSNGSSIQDRGKYSTESFRRRGGSFQVHFYYDRVTGEVSYNADYKTVFTGPGGR